MSTADVLIAGAGIVGLSTALELASKGLRVTVLERQKAMSEASWAAAGMLAAHDPENPSQLRLLSDLSITLYPDFLKNIEHLSGIQVPFRTSETLHGSELNRNLSGPLPHDEITKRIPQLNISGRQFILLKEHSLDPRDLCAALPRAAAAAGIRIIEESPVNRIRATATGIEVRASGTTYTGGQFVNCCGAWAGAIANHPAIEPRKGQMVTIKLPPGNNLEYVVRTPELYLVPRGDGRIIIGASVEHAGFDKSVEQSTIRSLLSDASELWPPVHKAEIVETWAGLRPGSADGLPVIGVSGEKNCWIASGHFRNGILLAPATARVMRELILGETPSVDLSSFRSDRFAEVSLH
ncbi:MAG TPA: glycine oxidase ThiO [Pseudacidobacterium sp.]|nr:glycine oxidase ThiO [Pseudacidobacterium sp.]